MWYVSGCQYQDQTRRDLFMQSLRVWQQNGKEEVRGTRVVWISYSCAYEPNLFFLKKQSKITVIYANLPGKCQQNVIMKVRLKFFWLCRNAQLKAYALRGFHPRRCGSPDAITPEQVLCHHRSAQGRYGGTGTVPSVILPASWISFQWRRNSTEPFFLNPQDTVFHNFFVTWIREILEWPWKP